MGIPKNRINRLVSTVGLCVLLAGVAQAGLIGHNVDVQYVWPSEGSVYQDLGTIAVLATPQTVTFQPYFDVTISDTHIVVNSSNYGGVYSGTFNGEYLIDTSAVAFPAFTVDPSSVLPGGMPIFTTDGNILQINFAGLTFGPGSQLVLDVGGSSVPEPATLGLVGFAIACLALRRRRLTT